MSILLAIFLSMLKIGCFAFGGGYAIIALLENEFITKRGWIDHDEFMDVVAIAESTPGPIMVNMATYIGSDQAGFWGSLVATVGVVLPAYLVILLIVRILKNAIKNPYVQAILRGLKPCVVGIVLATGVYMVVHNVLPLSAQALFDPAGTVITGMLCFIMLLYPRFFGKKLSPIALILCSAILGVIVFGI